MTEIKPLTVKELYHHCDPDQFEFETTEELEDLDQVVGQPRAVEAIKFGMGIQQEGYNIFVLGPSGANRRKLVQQFFERRASEEEVPSEWIYVYNFDEPPKPNAIELPPGMGAAFRRDMDKLTDELQTALSAAFESEEYQTRRQSLNEELQERQSEALEELQSRAQEQGVAIIRTPTGLAVAPMRDGEVLSPEDIQELPEEEQDEIRENVEATQTELQKLMRQMPIWQRELREKLEELNREIADFAVTGLINELKEKYAEFSEIQAHLEAVHEDIVQHADAFLRSEEDQQPQFLQMLRGAAGREEEGPTALQRYKVNLLVDHSETEGAPVVYEDNPTYQNLIGRVEHRARMGALVTDFSLIKPGALHRANGGYLVLDVRKLLTQGFAWDGLKRALQSDQIKIESVGQMLSLIGTVSLEPEAVPLDVKVALYGDRMLYYLLHQYDPDFAELFKVEADLAQQMDWNEENEELYAQLLATMAREADLRPFDRGAIARVIERSARLVSDKEKLSVLTRDIADLLREANYWAGENGNGVVQAEDVQRAIEAQIYRADRLRERVQETILRGTFMISTKGEEVGQVNGLSVIQLANLSFGRPTRITARVWLGKGQVVDIERETKLGGPIHSKGVLILTGFLSGHYVTDIPLALSASLVFEQSYGGIEGDSASSAELYALLSAIAEVPLAQSKAVTGSVNQKGEIQPIGGANEKIEGFFDICKARGLTGDQGVLIPASNVKHLMLRQDVREAVEAGEFNVYPVETVNQGIEILTGMEAGEQDEDGNYPEGTFNDRVTQKLVEYAEKRKEFGKSGEEGEEDMSE